MAKVLKAAIPIALTIVGAAIGGPIGAAVGAAVGTAASNALLPTKPKSPNVSPAASDRLSASIILRAPRTFVFGRTAMATDIRDQELSTDQAYLHRFIVVASHKAQAIEELWLDDKRAWTASGGVQAPFTGYLTVTPVLEGSATNAINIGARMGSSRRYTGCAYLYVKFRLTGTSSKVQSPFASAVPTRTTIIGKGAAVYDPRLDSTAGGSGPQRATDQSTWAWNDSAARNPALQLLTYLLGWRINGKLAVGKGIPAARIDLGSFITAANLCDETVARSAGGTEPRYRSDGIFSEADDLSTVLDNFKAAMNATLDDMDGRLRVTVLHNDLASPIGSLTTGDVLGAFTWAQTPPLSDSFNVVRGGYTDPSTTSLYQLVDYPEVAIASPDGIERVSTVNLPLVQSPSQAQRLAKTRLQRALVGGTFTATFASTAWKFQKGDVIALTFAPLGWAGKLFRIADMTVQVDGTVPMMLREEAASIYAWDASDAAAVAGAAPTTYDPSLSPVIQAIGDAARSADWDYVTGTRKAADNATRNDVAANLLRAPNDLDYADAIGQAQKETGAPGAGKANRDVNRFYFGQGFGKAVWDADVLQTPCTPGETLYYEVIYLSVGSPDGTLRGVLDFYDTGGITVASRTAFEVPGQAGPWVKVKGQVIVPDGAATCQAGLIRPAGTTGSFYAADGWLGSSERGADITALNQAAIDGPATIRVAADSAGTPTQPTATYAYKRLLGATDVSASTTWSILSSSGCTVSVDTGGVVTRSGALGASAKFTVRSARDGVTRDLAVSFIRDDAAPPVSTGSGGSGGSGGSSGSGNVSSSTTTNTYGSAGSESAFSCQAGSGGKVTISGSIDLSIFRSGRASASESGYAKLQYQAAGGSWTDAGGEQISDTQAVYDATTGDNSSGATISLTGIQVTGLSTTQATSFRALVRRAGTTSGVTASFSGTLTGAGS